MYPARIKPVCILYAPVEKCCLCGTDTGQGIYSRADPTALPCNGDHESGHK